MRNTCQFTLVYYIKFQCIARLSDFHWQRQFPIRPAGLMPMLHQTVYISGLYSMVFVLCMANNDSHIVSGYCVMDATVDARSHSLVCRIFDGIFLRVLFYSVLDFNCEIRSIYNIVYLYLSTLRCSQNKSDFVTFYPFFLHIFYLSFRLFFFSFFCLFFVFFRICFAYLILQASIFRTP